VLNRLLASVRALKGVEMKLIWYIFISFGRSLALSEFVPTSLPTLPPPPLSTHPTPPPPRPCQLFAGLAMMAMKHLLIVILLFLNPLLAASTDASTDTLQSCSVQLETLNVKHLAETKLLKAQIKALQSKYEPVNHLPAAKTLISSCDVHLNCASCLAANCGWCLGERACVPDKPWMCQGGKSACFERLNLTFSLCSHKSYR